MMRTRSILILCLCLGLVGWINWSLWTRPTNLTSLPPASRPGQSLETNPELPAGAAHFDNTLLQTYARPLFESSRRPYQPSAIEPVVLVDVQEEPPAIAVAEVIAELPGMRVLGIQRMPGHAQALLQLQGEDAAAWYRQSDSVGGWILKDIGSGRLTFTRDGQEASADLYPDARPADGVN